MKNFAIGGMSGMFATSCIQPIDMVKVRIQLKSESRAGNLSPFGIAKDIYRNEGGVKAFYKGIDSALLRQAVYATLRLGIYFNLSNYFKENVNHGGNLTTLQMVGSSLFAGAFGSFIGNPCDLALVRMQADSTLPPNERRNYKHVFDAFARIVKEEGITSCWNGATPTMCRAVSLNVAMLVSYDKCKNAFTTRLGKDYNPTLIQFYSSIVSAVMTSIASLPFDNIKTKLQKQKKNADGSVTYKGLLDCFAKSIKNESFFGLWAGLPTYYLRVGQHAMITLMISEQLRRLMF